MSLYIEVNPIMREIYPFLHSFCTRDKYRITNVVHRLQAQLEEHFRNFRF